jgi:hypothetical protein
VDPDRSAKLILKPTGQPSGWVVMRPGQDQVSIVRKRVREFESALGKEFRYCASLFPCISLC